MQQLHHSADNTLVLQQQQQPQLIGKSAEAIITSFTQFSQQPSTPFAASNRRFFNGSTKVDTTCGLSNLLFLAEHCS
jgi:hypothetical protein